MGKETSEGIAPRSVSRRSVALIGILTSATAILGIAVNMATGLLPEDWKWTRNPILIWGSVTVLVLLTGAISMVIAAGRPGTRGDGRPEFIARGSHLRQNFSVFPVTTDPSDRVRVSEISTSPQYSESPPSNQMITNFPPRNPVFTGREEVIQKVQQNLESAQGFAVVLCGLGGLGKTQVAIEVAYRGRDGDSYELAWWIRADSRLTILEDLADLAVSLDLPIDDNHEVMFKRVRNVLQRRKRWLLVFDNATSADAVIPWIPSGIGDVLVTSRFKGWLGSAHEIQLENFSREESTTFIRRQFTASENLADALAAEVADFPLALAQATSYINRTGLSVDGYLDLYRTREGAARMLASNVPSYRLSVATTWLIHFNDLSANNPTALELLRLSSFLDPDDINVELMLTSSTELRKAKLPHLRKVADQPLDLAEIIGILASTGLVTPTGNLRFRLHRLVAEVTRRQVSKDRTSGTKLWANRVAGMLLGIFPGNPRDPATWQICAELVAHVLAIVRNGANSVKAGNLLHQLGKYLAARGAYTDARRVINDAINIIENSSGLMSAELAATLGDLGIVEDLLGNIDDATRIQYRVLAIRRAIHGANSVETARALGNIGLIEKKVGNIDEAANLLRKALAIFERQRTHSRAEVALALNNLAYIEVERGKLAEAQTLAKRAISINEKVYRADHLETGISLCALGYVQLKRSDFETARSTYLQALDILERAYGSSHPGLVAALRSLSLISAELGDPSAQRDYLDRAREIAKATLGTGHRDVADLFDDS